MKFNKTSLQTQGISPEENGSSQELLPWRGAEIFSPVFPKNLEA
jgi:hypothetical protein